MKRQTLTVTLATFNEENNIGKCLFAVKLIADEIIVVDGNSTDNTVKIARKYGAKVIRTTNKANFHINKALANKRARSDWILQLDADELVTPALAGEIRRLLEGKTFGYNRWLSTTRLSVNKFLPLFPSVRQLDHPAAAYWLKRKNYFLGRYLTHGGQYPDPVIRLFQRDRANLPAKDVHEQMVVTGEIGWLAAPLNHFATPQFSRYITRENRYSSLLAQQLLNTGVSINPFNTFLYLFARPTIVFLKLYIRYRGFLDGFPGFVFSLFSGLHFSLAYIKLWQLQLKND